MPPPGDRSPAQPGTAPEPLAGAVERITFRNDENGYCVLKVRVPGRREPVTVVGTAPTVSPGERIEAAGEWVRSEQFGHQFKAESIRTSPPSGRDGLIRYLGSGMIEGIGPVYAERIVERFGDDVFDIIDNASRRLEEVEGIGPKRRREIKESWEKQKAVRRIMLFLHENRVSTARAVRIHQKYGEDAIRIVRENPYQLAEEIWGVGFKTADQIAGNLGIRGDAPQRVRAGLHYFLERAAEDGHCAFPVEQAVSGAAGLLAVGEAVVASACDEMVREGALVRETLGGEPLLYLPHLRAAEFAVARQLLALSARTAGHPAIDADRALEWVERETGRVLAPGQRSAVAEALARRVLVITGGPGVGKTTVVDAILRILTTKGVRPVLAAPTGRAAKRLAESSGRSASTLHRLLEYQPARGFGRDAGHPLDGDIFLVDETSMIDAPLMAALLKALPAGAHLVLVGDVDQLPSVGPGQVLADIIASGTVPVVRLTEVFRQDARGGIVAAAHAINQGVVPGAAAEGSGPSVDDFFFVRREDPAAAVETILHVVRDRLPRAFGFDPIRDIQVLTPMHRGPLGTTALNAALQGALNPPGAFKTEVERFGTNFRVGDKVLQLRNNYDNDVFNGDIGVIVAIGDDPVTVQVRFDEGRTAVYAPTELDELALAYAITIHKSQGSEFPAVVVPMTTGHYMMLQRNLVYTAVTRGRRRVVLVGDPKAFEMAVRRADASTRWTGLRHRLAAGPADPSL